MCVGLGHLFTSRKMSLVPYTMEFHCWQKKGEVQAFYTANIEFTTFSSAFTFLRQSKDQFLYSTLGINFNQVSLTSKISIQEYALLETMSKVSTSDAECSAPLQNGEVQIQKRPISQLSTHV